MQFINEFRFDLTLVWRDYLGEAPPDNIEENRNQESLFSTRGDTWLSQKAVHLPYDPAGELIRETTVSLKKLTSQPVMK